MPNLTARAKRALQAAESDQVHADEEGDGEGMQCETATPEGTELKWWRTPECVTHLVMYGILAFFSTFLDEVRQFDTVSGHRVLLSVAESPFSWSVSLS